MVVVFCFFLMCVGLRGCFCLFILGCFFFFFGGYLLVFIFCSLAAQARKTDIKY